MRPDPADTLESQGVVAQTHARQRRTELAVVANHRPWVWEVRSGRNRLWIAGCLHLGADPDAYAFQTYVPYYERAAEVYFEVMPSAWQNIDVSTLIGRRGYAPGHRNLSGRISAEAWRDVRVILRGDLGLFGRIQAMEPWLACLTITQEGYRRAGLSREVGLEYFIEERARVDRKPVGALEKAQEQVFAMADTNMEDQESNLRSALANYARPDFGSTEIRRAWRSGDDASLRKALGGGTGESDDEMHHNLLAKRNQQWVRKIAAILASGRPALLVVGVEHLVSGPQSLPNLLKAADCTVQRVSAGARVEAPATAAAR